MNTATEKLYEEARAALERTGRSLEWRRYEHRVLANLYGGEDDARLQDKIREYKSIADRQIHLEVPEAVYSQITERALAAKRDIDLVAGPNPIEPRIARARENIRQVVEGLKQIEIVPEGPLAPAPAPDLSEEEIQMREAEFPEKDTIGL